MIDECSWRLCEDVPQTSEVTKSAHVMFHYLRHVRPWWKTQTFVPIAGLLHDTNDSPSSPPTQPLFFPTPHAERVCFAASENDPFTSPSEDVPSQNSELMEDLHQISISLKPPNVKD